MTGGVVTVVVSLAMAVAMVAASQWPVARASEDAAVRLSWRTEPIRIEECRTLTPEELEGVPAHMRRTEECTGALALYELTLRIDERRATVDTVAPAGLRGDRPVYVLREESVPAGAHRVEVSFEALLPEDFTVEDRPVRLEWSGTLDLEPREVALLTTDEGGTGIVVRRAR